MTLLPIGTRIERRCGLTVNGKPIDCYVGLRGTVVGHNMNYRNTSKQNMNPLRYNKVLFDGGEAPTEWVEGHAGIVPLDPITLLGEIV